MAKPYFHDVWFQQADDVSSFASEAKFKKLTDEMHWFILRSTGLREYLQVALRREKASTMGAEFRELGIYLTATPSNKPRPWKKGDVRDIYVDVGFDIHDLSKIKMGNEEIGELFISWIESALEKLSGFQCIPRELIANTLQEYRETNYTYSYKSGERTIPGTKLKGRIDVSFSCLSEIHVLSISYRGKQLFSKEITRTGQVSATYMRFFRKFRFDGKILAVEKTSPLVPEVTLDLGEIPSIAPYLEKLRK